MKSLSFYFTLIVLAVTSVARGQSTDPFFNEVNYKSSNPAMRGAEIAGPADTDLSDWSIVSYNKNGTVANERAINSGTIPDLQNGRGAIWYDVEQSSQPSGGSTGGGMALVKPDGTVVQFISFGKNLIFNVVITAVEGPASGMTSQYIGTQLLSGSSLQLTGIALDYLGFIWAIPGGTTPGAVNTNQIFGLLEDLLGLLLLNEPVQNPQIAQMLSNAGNSASDQFAGSFKLKLYPNPVLDFLEIDLSQVLLKATEIRVIDASGHVVKTVLIEPTATNYRLDLKALPAGPYAVQFATDAGPMTKIILKQ